MSFDLRIRFNGLCLMVPDPEKKDPPERPARFHVLLPDVKHEHGAGDGSGAHTRTWAGAAAGQGEGGGGTVDHAHAGAAGEHRAGGEHEHDGAGGGEPGEAGGGGAGGGEPGEGGGEGAAEIVEHLPRLIYDRAYETAPAEGVRRELERRLRCVDVRGHVLDLTGIGIDEIDVSVPREVASLDDVAGANKLPRKFVDGFTGVPELAARVTADRGCVTDCLVGVQATLLNEEPRRMTAQVEWTIRGIDGESLTLRRKGLNEAADGDEIQLFPIGRTIHLEVWNVPKHELPGAPRPVGVNAEDRPTEHFEAFYDLLAGVTEADRAVPIPTDLQPPVASECFVAAAGDLGEPIVPNGLRCMTGQASLASS